MFPPVRRLELASPWEFGSWPRLLPSAHSLETLEVTQVADVDATLMESVGHSHRCERTNNPSQPHFHRHRKERGDLQELPKLIRLLNLEGLR